MTGCIFTAPGTFTVLSNQVPNKEVVFQTTGSIATAPDFTAEISPGPGRVDCRSDILEDDERWARYVRTGESIPHDRVREWLQNLADGNVTAPPK